MPDQSLTSTTPRDAVLLYRMGVAGLAVWLGPVAVAWTAWRLALRRDGRTLAAAAFAVAAFAVAALAVAIVAADGLLQEDAPFAPLAKGSCMLLAGIALGEALPADVAAPAGMPEAAAPAGGRAR